MNGIWGIMPQSLKRHEEEVMALYSASVKYKFGSGKATTSTNITTNQLKGKSESAVMEFLRGKHKSTKNLEILIEKIDWK
jgi:hypothetical protein